MLQTKDAETHLWMCSLSNHTSPVKQRTGYNSHKLIKNWVTEDWKMLTCSSVCWAEHFYMQADFKTLTVKYKLQQSCGYSYGGVGPPTAAHMSTTTGFITKQIAIKKLQLCDKSQRLWWSSDVSCSATCWHLWARVKCSWLTVILSRNVHIERFSSVIRIVWNEAMNFFINWE